MNYISLDNFYYNAHKTVLEAGYLNEIKWQEDVLNNSFSESDFLAESAWVILCSGFKESYIRKIFDHISLAFCDWESAQSIIENEDNCRSIALSIFGNTRKIEAIISISKKLTEIGFTHFKSHIERDTLKFLSTLPMIGNITANHLAKNLGYSVAKADRHLVRIAEQHGYQCVDNFCNDIAVLTGENIAVIDIILWRYGVLNTH